MKKKIKILRIIDTLDKIYGGPSNTIIDSSKILSKKGFRVDILTHDHDYGDTKVNNNIKIFNKGPNFTNYFLNIKITLWLLKNRHRYDFFIIHGIWKFKTLLARFLLKGRYFVFTHGMLDPYFGTEFFKNLKKNIFWLLIEKKNLTNSNTILLTSNNEKKSLDQTYVNTSGIKKTVISYGIKRTEFSKKISLKIFYKKFPELHKKKFVLFLGRFHKKKGCEVLLESVKILKKKNIDIRVLLVGPDNQYKKKLMKLAKNNQIESNLIWSNFLSGKLKWGAIYASKAMVLSSHGENFGVSIVESLSCGKPVLITNKVNIFNYIKNYNAGYVSSDNNLSFSKILEKFYKLQKRQMLSLVKNSVYCFNREFNLERTKNGLDKFLKDQYYNNLKNKKK